MPRKYALTLAYEHYNRYLDSDSADSGPIEDYIAAAITEGMTQTARRCAEIGESAVGLRGHVEGALAVADEIRREFGLEQEQGR